MSESHMVMVLIAGMGTIICGIASSVALDLKSLNKSVNHLNEKMAVVIMNLSDHRNILEKHEIRFEKIESKFGGKYGG